MQAYKVKGRIDATGHLVVNEPIELTPGDVEVIVLQPSLRTVVSPMVDSTPELSAPVNCEIPVLKQWLEQSYPVPSNFDPDNAKWEYLKEKHNL